MPETSESPPQSDFPSSGTGGHIDLSHVIRAGMTTYPGLPIPTIADHLTREAAEEIYGPGVTFQIGLITICTNTGTYLDVPFHRFADGHDLTELDLGLVAAVPATCLDCRGHQAIDIDPADAAAAAGHAVLIRTDHSRYFGQPEYGESSPYLTARSARILVDGAVACVGIDSMNIDDTDDQSRPVHTALLGAGIPIVEHLTNLHRLPGSAFTFTAVPPKMAGAGTFTVRAFATVG